ncbi:MAG: SH3 domain-containing protein [Vicingus serpentipes]|nr:SH3 domain-containing protein [Vicingus serpentipes]
MKRILNLLIIPICLTSFISCSESNNSDITSSDSESNSTTPTFGSLTDPRDNHSYKTVVINGDTWMAENLNVTHFRNGDEIPQVQNDRSWYDLRTPAWCYYNNDPKSEALYGKLYNWYAVTDERGLAPEGWHIPSKEDWEKLMNGDKEIGFKMKAEKDWDNSKYHNNVSTGNNAIGFTGLPGGWRHHQGSFDSQGGEGRWWSSNKPALGYILKTQYKTLNVTWPEVRDAFSVRCVKGNDGFKVSVKETAPEEKELEEIQPEQEYQVNVDYYKINDPDGYSNLRDAPKGEVLQKVYDTEKFEVIGTEDDYKKVKLSSGTTGYIHKSRVVKL